MLFEKRSHKELSKRLMATGHAKKFFRIAFAVLVGTELVVPLMLTVILVTVRDLFSREIGIGIGLACVVYLTLIVVDLFSKVSWGLAIAEQYGLAKTLNELMDLGVLIGPMTSKKPDIVVFVSDTGFSIGYRYRYGPLGPALKTLTLSKPLMDILTVDELRAVMAHEFAHTLDPYVFRTFCWVFRESKYRAVAWLVRYLTPVRSLIRSLREVNWKDIGKVEEPACDEVAKNLVGRECFNELLFKSYAFSAIVGEKIGELAYEDLHCAKPVWNNYCERLATAFAERIGQTMTIEKGGRNPTHPPLSTRLCEASESWIIRGVQLVESASVAVLGDKSSDMDQKLELQFRETRDRVWKEWIEFFSGRKHNDAVSQEIKASVWDSIR